MSSDSNNSKALVAFLLISVPIDTLFLLTAYNTENEATVVAFSIMMLASFLSLVVLRSLDKTDDDEPISFTASLGWIGAGIGIGVGLLTLVINVFAGAFFSAEIFRATATHTFDGIKGIAYNSVIFVPQFFSTAEIGRTSSAIYNSVFELMMTAGAEEGLKAAMLYGFYLLTGNQVVSVVSSVGIWAGFHTILVGFTLPEVGLAFLSGVIWYVAWHKTGSLLTPILAHGTYDASIVILSSALGQ